MEKEKRTLKFSEIFGFGAGGMFTYGFQLMITGYYLLYYMTDIAATVCAMLHIQAPNGCIGTPIF